MATKNKTNSLISNLGIGKPKATASKVETAPVEATPEVRPSTENGCKAGEARTTVILNCGAVKNPVNRTDSILYGILRCAQDDRV